MVLEIHYEDHHQYPGIHVQKEKIVKKGIAFFDFDGTITTKDTLLEFIKFSKGNFRFYLGFLVNSPYLVAYKTKVISNQAAKEKVLQYFFRNMPVDAFEKLCEAFTQKYLPSLIRPGALREIEKLKRENYVVVVVSASPENWIRQWANENGVELIASRLETKEGMITGMIVGKNCHGEEKVRRIMEKYVITDYSTVHAYGDTTGDRPMMALATNSFFKPFRD
jgi:phosphatidylglycerophosphatase C